MKIQIWKGMLAAAIFSVVLSSPAKAQDGDNDGCSNATLHGDYAFAIHGESLGVFVPQTTGAPKLVPFASPVLIDGVAITHFDGNGILKQVDFSMHNGTSVATPDGSSHGKWFPGGGDWHLFGEIRLHRYYYTSRCYTERVLTDPARL
jgi:hypothetical protein